jgi:hypothetical protein
MPFSRTAPAVRGEGVWDVRALRTGIALLLAAALSACAGHGPLVDTGPKPPDVGGTISGRVHEAGSDAPLSGRKVTATEVSTGSRFEASTAANGGYTIKVPQGKYRIEVELRAGETLAEKPTETDINASDLDADRNFVVTVRAPGN